MEIRVIVVLTIALALVLVVHRMISVWQNYSDMLGNAEYWCLKDLRKAEEFDNAGVKDLAEYYYDLAISASDRARYAKQPFLYRLFASTLSFKDPTTVVGTCNKALESTPLAQKLDP